MWYNWNPQNIVVVGILVINPSLHRRTKFQINTYDRTAKTSVKSQETDIHKKATIKDQTYFPESLWLDIAKEYQKRLLKFYKSGYDSYTIRKETVKF